MNEVQGIWLRRVDGRLRIVIDAGGHLIGMLNNEGGIDLLTSQRQFDEIEDEAGRYMRAKRGAWFDPRSTEEIESIFTIAAGGGPNSYWRLKRHCPIGRELAKALARIKRDRDAEAGAADAADGPADPEPAGDDQPSAR